MEIYIYLPMERERFRLRDYKELTHDYGGCEVKVCPVGWQGGDPGADGPVPI